MTRLTEPVKVGEGPFWDEERRSLYFVNSYEATVLRYEIDTKQIYSTQLGNVIPT